MIGATSVAIGVDAVLSHFPQPEQRGVSGRKIQAWGYRPFGSTSSKYPHTPTQPGEVVERVSAPEVIPVIYSLDLLLLAVARRWQRGGEG